MKKRQGLLSLLGPYRGLLSMLLLFSLISNIASLSLPRLVGLGINQCTQTGLAPIDLAWQFVGVCSVVFVFASLQSLVQIYTSERTARDLRERLANHISEQSCQFVQRTEPSRLLTNLTSDVDAVKAFVADALVGLLTSLVILLGASLMLLYLNWRLALGVLSLVPLIGFSFALVLKRLRPVFRETRQVVDRLNKVIHESVVGAALIRVVHGGPREGERFAESNQRARDLGLTILRHFALLIPIVNMVAQLASVVILGLGGQYVIRKQMEVGDLATFYGYLSLMIFPIFVIGFMQGLIAQASSAFERICEVLDSPPEVSSGPILTRLHGQLEAQELCLSYSERLVLDHVSVSLQPGTRTAVLGPTAAGKTQLLYVLSGLLPADSGTIRYDGQEYHRNCLHGQVAIVFQESILFDLSILENIAFSDSIRPEVWRRALETAELLDFVEQLPDGADTRVSERGTRLSGGQKQRLMLARALAQEPAILLLDDFTARVDPVTERKILDNLKRNYPQLTLLAVTQRISTVQDYDHILLMMEGAVLAQGTHAELLQQSPEYMQIFESQKSTQQYEISTDGE
jgi:ATP-binding cassette subfamily B protein